MTSTNQDFYPELLDPESSQNLLYHVPSGPLAIVNPASSQRGHLILRFPHADFPVNPEEPVVILAYQRVSCNVFDDYTRNVFKDAFQQAPKERCYSPISEPEETAETTIKHEAEEITELTSNPTSEEDSRWITNEEWNHLKLYFGCEDDEDDPPVTMADTKGVPYEGTDGEIRLSLKEELPSYLPSFDENDEELLAYLASYPSETKTLPSPDTLNSINTPISWQAESYDAQLLN